MVIVREAWKEKSIHIRGGMDTLTVVERILRQRQRLRTPLLFKGSQL